jgi:uncharacterized CHY-type Zn-finger protein
MNDTPKAPEVENFLNELSINLFGRYRSLAKAGKSCVSCGKPATEFKDELSRKEYNISGLCQNCQNEIFG